MEIENTSYAEWLENAVKYIFEAKPSCMALVVTLKNGRTLTGYYNADVQDMAVFAHNIQSDITLELIRNNAELIREAIEGEEHAD